MPFRIRAKIDFRAMVSTKHSGPYPPSPMLFRIDWASPLSRRRPILLDRQGFEILMIGGRIDQRAGSAVGIQAALEIRRIRADLCFPGTCAIGADTGIWGMSNEEALVKRAMIESSGETAIVVTTDKFAAVAAHQIAALDQIDHLVVEHGVDRNILVAFKAKSIDVHRADEG